MRQLVGALQLVQAHSQTPLSASLRALALVLPLVVFGGCTPQPATRPEPVEPRPMRPEPPSEPKPSPYGFREEAGYARSAEEVSGPAVINLLGQARADLAAGRVEQAVATLETALQIEKRNPFVWQQLAAAHLKRLQPEDAEIVAQRSNGFARGNPYIEIENWRLIATARAARGDRDGADQAREKIAELQDRIED
jgi:tetratricopeptide (TPR) repeat protein